MKGAFVAETVSGRRSGRNAESVRSRPVVVRGGAMILGVVAAAVLLSLDWRPSIAFDWFQSVGSMGGTSPEANLVVIGRLAVVVLVLWLIGSGVAYAGARLTRRAALIRTVGWITLPAVRRVAERFVALMLTLATVVGGGGRLAVAGTGPTVLTPVGAVTLQVSSTSEESGLSPPMYLPTPAGDIDPGLPPIVPLVEGGTEPRLIQGPWHPALPPIGLVQEPVATLDSVSMNSSPTPAVDDRKDYVVAAGDNLWVIAERHLQGVLGRSPTDPETATYWSQVIRMNREQLRSGDPDLIYPGETVGCPPVAEVTPELVPGAGTP